MFYKVFVTNLFVSSSAKATTWGPFIFIRPTAEEPEALIEHEKVHVKHFWSNPLFGLWYKFSKDARLKYEAEAYAVQAQLVPDRLPRFAYALANNYGLNITVDEALAAIRSYMK